MNNIIEPWQESVIEEKNILQNKYIKLIEYINSEKFHSLSENHLKLLNNQKIIMEAYLKVLGTRLYDDIDNLTVIDYSWVGIMLGAFTNKPFFDTPTAEYQNDKK